MSNSVVGTIFRRTWRGLDVFRRFVHLILMLVMAGLLLAALVPKSPTVTTKGALVINPKGALVEQLSGDAVERAIARAQGAQTEETLVKDLVDAIEAGAEDEDIKALILDLDEMTGAGLPKLMAVTRAIEVFKSSGKPVIATGDGFGQSQYYIAAHADEVMMHPLGFVYVDGFSRYPMYMQAAIEKLSIDLNVWRVGEYKSFVEPYIRNDMSAEDRESAEAYLSALWEDYQEGIASVRELPEGGLQTYADNAVELLEGVEGDTAALALNYGLVDELASRDRVRARLLELAGADPEDDNKPALVGFERYLGASRMQEVADEADDKVAVVVAVGPVADGVQPGGTIGGDSTARLIRKAMEDDDVKALVLRIDSPGGSVFGSEVIARAVQVFRDSGRPVVASMGSVAASGGYYIAMGADEIWANPSTITGSIGVGAFIPTFQRSMERLGLNVDGVGTTQLSGQSRVDRALGEDVRALIGQSVNQTYRAFVGDVAKYREQSFDDIDKVARGRVWIGASAYELGLVDELGTLDEAIQSAANRAGLEPDSFSIDYVDRELSWGEQLLLRFTENAAYPIGVFARALRPDIPEPLAQVAETFGDMMAEAPVLNDPRNLYSFCFCAVE